MRRVTATLGLTILTLFGASGEAVGAVVAKEGSVLVYRAAPGENPTLEISYLQANPPRNPQGRYSFVEESEGEEFTPLGTGAGCESVGGGAGAICQAGGVESVRVDTGDLGDLIVLRDAGPDPITVTGGSGNDSLEVSAWGGRVTFDGGSGDDDLSGADLTRGGSGNDRLSSNENGARIVGGSGDDTIGVGDSVLVLRPRLVLLGGAGDDRISGDDRGDKLDGGQGNDLMVGGGGKDMLRGGPGNDRMQGDEGNDTFYGGDGRDVMRGFSGSDTFYARDRSKDLVDGGSTVEFKGVNRTRPSRNRARVDRRDVLRSIQRRF